MSDAISTRKVRPINIAVVGLGFMGATHLRAYLNHPKAKIVAVCGRKRVPINGVLPGNSAPQIVTAREALTALQICEAEEQSIRQNRLVEF